MMYHVGEHVNWGRHIQVMLFGDEHTVFLIDNVLHEDFSIPDYMTVHL